ncbi:MAG: hypothetical protein ACJA0H_001244 [Francisellaceae bacterium]|jgi:hypothetical protein
MPIWYHQKQAKNYKMENIMAYIIECCGPSKDYFSNTEISLVTDNDLNSIELKALLLNNISPESCKEKAYLMLEVCLIASEKKVLDQHQYLPQNEILFLLPPVCGG